MSFCLCLCLSLSARPLIHSFSLSYMTSGKIRLIHLKQNLMDSMLAFGILNNSRFFFSSSSFRNRAPAMKLICSTIHPGRCIVLLSADLKDAYCSSATHLVPTTYRLVTSDMRLNSIFPSSHFFRWGQRTRHLLFSCRVPQCLLRAMIKDLCKFLSQLFPHCTKAFCSINTDKAPLRGG